MEQYLVISTTLDSEQGARELGQMLVDTICERITDSEHPPQCIVLAPELIIRESSGYEARR